MNSLDSEFLRRVEGTPIEERVRFALNHPNLTFKKNVTLNLPDGNKIQYEISPNCQGMALWLYQMEHLAQALSDFSHLLESHFLDFSYVATASCPFPFAGEDVFEYVLDRHFQRVEITEAEMGLAVVIGSGRNLDPSLFNNPDHRYIDHVGVFARGNKGFLIFTQNGIGGPLETCISHSGQEIWSESSLKQSYCSDSTFEEIAFYVPK
jgi:hypothetical protein